jgi:spore photoproduct lyase
MPIQKENPVQEMEYDNSVHEENLAYYPKETQEPLVRELWAIRSISNKLRVKQIAGRSGLPLIWLDKAPGINGEKGIEKIRAERGILLLRERTSPFIEQFQHPIGRCAKFYKLTAYNNCNFWCEYCYLYLTFRTQPVSTHFINYEKMYDEIIKFDRSKKPKALMVLNLGELGDPLAISFSVNTDAVFQQLEHRTASPDSRLIAAAKVQKAGYEVRLRIDPVIYYSTWEKDYIALVEKIFEYVQPTRITIGEYRPSNGLANHISARFPKSALLKVNKSLVREGKKLRYPKNLRVKMFRTIIDAIKKHRSDIDISLCKEQAEIWKALGLGMKGLSCNCVN